MSETLLVSNVVLWCVVVVLCVVVVALVRQVGLLHERIMPAGALSPRSGPRVGQLTEAMTLPGLDDQSVVIGGPAGDDNPTLVLWISPTCPVCRSLVPTARSLARDERLRLVFSSDGGTVEDHRRYVSELGIDRYPYVLSQQLGMTYAVGRLPFAALIGADGVLRAKGLVNTREHLESLVEAMETGVETLQDYVRSLDPESAEKVS